MGTVVTLTSGDNNIYLYTFPLNILYSIWSSTYAGVVVSTYRIDIRLYGSDRHLDTGNLAGWLIDTYRESSSKPLTSLIYYTSTGHWCKTTWYQRAYTDLGYEGQRLKKWNKFSHVTTNLCIWNLFRVGWVQRLSPHRLLQCQTIYPIYVKWLVAEEEEWGGC